MASGGNGTASSTGGSVCGKGICEEGESGLILPAFGESEQKWPNALRIIIYFLLLIWFFMGVAIVADVFMGAIEKITSKKIRKWDGKAGKHYTYTVWNDTVANLTLMALGSSAPEILLSLIELFGDSFYSGALGPSTIVGSAAFNLFCISAVCVIAIPDGESRTIKDISVFAITATFSVLAYVWLLIIVKYSSENIIEIWEGVVTFLFFPLLVLLAFMADKGYFNLIPDQDKPEAQEAGEVARKSLSDMTKEELAQLQTSVQMKNTVQLTDEQLVQVIESELLVHRSRAQYRVQATRAATGGRRVAHVSNPHKQIMAESVSVKSSQVVPEEVSQDECVDEKTPLIFQFTAYSYAVMENIGELCIPVQLIGEGFEKPVSVDIATVDGSAKANSDYVPIREKLFFSPGETRKDVMIKIIDDAAYEDDEMFFVELKNPNSSEGKFKAQLGEQSKATVAILDDDAPGVLSFEEESMEVCEKEKDSTVTTMVIRKGGCNGKISASYHTESDTAMEGRDFYPAKGSVAFAPGQTSAKIDLVIKPVGRYEKHERFRLILTDPKGGCRFDKKTDGGESCDILTVIIKPNETLHKQTDKIMATLIGNWDKAQIGHSNWKDQFRDALMVGGGDDEEGPPSQMDYVMHVITIFWKVLFACIPPVDFCDGWLCFIAALIMIGVVTAFIADLAGLLGCCLTLPDEITAITFVALGTSLPDTFASKAAAEQDPYADASIGNVTGSNSVNVFLGLGLPWMVGAIYWTAVGFKSEWKDKYPEVYADFKNGGKFVVMGGDLGFSVTVFSLCAVTCIGILMVRRIKWKAELGGPPPLKQISAVIMVGLWLIYVSLSSWKVLKTRSDNGC